MINKERIKILEKAFDMACKKLSLIDNNINWKDHFIIEAARRIVKDE